ncbi:hypothetical protein diail_4456 [Diaporthe ilicicola]|nr:hypothetical protein diail_4456 [Diaporthe ilicicola]
MAIFFFRPRDFLHALPTKWYHIDFFPLAPARFLRRNWPSRLRVCKKVLQTHALDNPPVSAQQAAIAASMPEAPPQAHALVSAEHNLAAHLADREIQQSIVARLAGQTGAAAHHFRCAGKAGGVRPLRAPAERAEKRFWLRGGDANLWWAKEGVAVSITHTVASKLVITM